MSTTAIRCASTGCPNAIRVDPRHVENVTATPWQCPAHRPTDKDTQ